MIKNKGYWLLLGYTLFTLGFTSIVMQLVGVNWAFLHFLQFGGGLWAFVAYIFMVLLGVLTIVIAQRDWERERRESEQ